MVSIAAEDVHETGRVHNSGMAISRSRFAALNEARLLRRRILGSQSFAALEFRDQLAIDLKALISVLNDEGILHAYTGG